jgi:translation initiation factor IF-1
MKSSLEDLEEAYDKMRKKRKRIKAGDLVKQVNFRHERYGKIGLVISVQKFLVNETYSVLCAGDQEIWFAGDAQKIREVKNVTE